ncbi:MAG: acyltransferase [Clostridia bacterium]|nr:acyltransferase [Clostridia bacterium]
MEGNTRQRNSSIELLKIFAIALILIAHSVPEYFSTEEFTFTYGSASANLAGIIFNLLSCLGYVGDAVFIVCSSYFLADSKRVKVNKVVSIVLTNFIFSVCFLAIYLALGYKVGISTALQQIFPAVTQTNWYVSFYLLLYIAHPVINIVINRLDKLAHAIVAGYLFFHCCIIVYALGNDLSVNKFLCWICIYFIVAYIKKYGSGFAANVRLNAVVCVSSAMLYIVWRIVLNYLGLYSDYFYARQRTYSHINCPFTIVFAVTLFNIANNRRFVNKGVNYLSSLSLPIYIIHHNNLFTQFTQNKIYDWWAAVFGADSMLLCIFALAAFFMAACAAIGTVYRFTIEKLVNKIATNLQLKADCFIIKIKERYKKHTRTQ